MDLVTLIALLCLLSSAIWSCIQRAWPFALLAVGLMLWLLSSDATLTVT